MVPFSFTAETHEYALHDGRTVVPSITQILKMSGWVDDTWFNDEASERGREVHRLTAAWDMRALPADWGREAVSEYRGYLLAHEKATALVRPSWANIELPRVESRLGFAGTIDRDGAMFGAVSVAEVKTGPARKAVVNGYASTDHAIQLALQAILLSEDVKLPPEASQKTTTIGPSVRATV